ncbi:MAG: hypothetical protein JW751_03715 [Polyangiaceae bacterium]|nr:hypothetical protein [Polyangiaceae bacterium]
MIGACLLGGCGRTTAPAIELVLGEDDRAPRTIAPKSAWAEHLAVPGARNELRIVLGTGDIPCDRYVPLGDDEVLLTITITSPLERPIGPGVYAWTESTRASDPKAPTPPLAIPKVVIGNRSIQPLPGGGIELRRVELPPQGMVTGVLGFAFPGGAGAPATSIKGTFAARSCVAGDTIAP